MLELRLLTKRYRSIPAVQDVSFTLRPGEIPGYVGPNGSGKSTTVKMLTGLLEPTSGHIFYRGADIRQDMVGYKRRMGYVPEEPYLYVHLSGLEYPTLAGRLRGMDAVSLTRKVEDLLTLFDLRESRFSPLASYSKGMRQRILIAAALLDDPVAPNPSRRPFIQSVVVHLIELSVYSVIGSEMIYAGLRKPVWFAVLVVLHNLRKSHDQAPLEFAEPTPEVIEQLHLLPD